MNPKHHPSAEVLVACAAGNLRPAFAFVTAAHLHACAQCRADVRLMEEVGGVLLESLPPTAMEPDALERIKARIERPSEPIELSDADRTDLIASLKLRARRWVAPGVWMAPVALEGVGDDFLFVLRIPAGARTFEHGHNGQEFTAVLRGAYNDGIADYAAGDFQEVNAEDEHQPVVADDGYCVCLIAAEAPMKMRSRLGRLAQLYLNV